MFRYKNKGLKRTISDTRIKEQKAKCSGNTTKYSGARIKKRQRCVQEIKSNVSVQE